jgi:hypothetical protein
MLQESQQQQQHTATLFKEQYVNYDAPSFINHTQYQQIPTTNTCHRSQQHITFPQQNHIISRIPRQSFPSTCNTYQHHG